MAIIIEQAALIIRPADRDGFCPALQPGECCQDRIHRLWHFCTPEGGRFAIGNTNKQQKIYVRVTKAGLSICNGVMEWAARKKERLQNYWTVTEGKWVDCRPL